MCNNRNQSASSVWLTSFCAKIFQDASFNEWENFIYIDPEVSILYNLNGMKFCILTLSKYVQVPKIKSSHCVAYRINKQLHISVIVSNVQPKVRLRLRPKIKFRRSDSSATNLLCFYFMSKLMQKTSFGRTLIVSIVIFILSKI